MLFKRLVMILLILTFGYSFIIFSFSKFDILVITLLTFVLATAVNTLGKNLVTLSYTLINFFQPLFC